MDWESLTDDEREALASGRLPVSIHPHDPFVFILLLLSRESTALIHLWKRRIEHRTQIVTRWCALAKTHPWAWPAFSTHKQT